MALLRSHAHGEHLQNQGDKRYRVSRSIQFDILQGVLFGLSKSSATSEQDDHSEKPTANTRVFCEVLINSECAAITTSQKCLHRAFSWHQTFTFTELPELISLQVNLKREKKGDDPILLGTAFLDAQDWRRGVTLSGHLPICSERPGLDSHRVAVGEIKYKCRFEE
jgi:hypothetical protein